MSTLVNMQMFFIWYFVYKDVIVLFSGRGGAGLPRRATNPNDMQGAMGGQGRDGQISGWRLRRVPQHRGEGTRRKRHLMTASS